ncbi:MAG: hypothetical protein QOE65_288 [Solirubrobacteraceae bacterium]|jgi:hypothetical protein|nr:hypothetical protein [Solirubrobacteraceae bacterium]
MTQPRAGSGSAPAVAVTDLIALGPIAVLALAATASLALAHLHHHSLHGVLLGTSLGVVALVGVALRLGGRPRVTVDRADVAVMLASGALAAFMFLPGFSYGVADKDPGVYVAHAREIARDASISFTDPALAAPGLPVQEASPGARFAGIWVRDRASGRIVPQFYHLWPALLATSYDAGGLGALRATTPVLGMLAVLAVVALLLRLGGVGAGAVGGLLLSTNMLQVWGAKFPGTEALAEVLFTGTVLAAALAARERWPPFALVAGLLAGTGFLARPDGWLVVALGAAALAALHAVRGADRLVAWGAAGLSLSLPFALWQAYSAAEPYTTSNAMPSLAQLLILLGLIAIAAVAARHLGANAVRRVVGALSAPRGQRIAGAAVCAAAAALVAVGYLRPWLFGEGRLDASGDHLRSYDEENLARLTWFFTLPGILLAWAGVAVVALRRWRASAWIAVAPALVLAPAFAYHAHVASRLMWWTRRFVSNVAPELIVLIALALGFALAWRHRGRRVLALPALAVTAGLAAVFLSQSLPLRHHDEWHGSFAVSRRVAQVAGANRGVFLWQKPAHCCFEPTQLWAAPVWLAEGQLSVLLPPAPERQPAYVAAYRRRFSSQPLFVVWNGAGSPPWGARLGLTQVEHLRGELPFWEESDTHRPDHARRTGYELRVFRVPDA